jgi:hypothetical protein
MLTCANCGMEQPEWQTPHGVEQDGERYCCEGCAGGSGCTCGQNEARDSDLEQSVTPGDRKTEPGEEPPPTE